MGSKIAGQLPLTTFFQPGTRKRKKENVPVSVVPRPAKRKRSGTTVAQAASSSQQDCHEIIDLTETQNSDDLPSSSFLMRDRDLRATPAMNNRQRKHVNLAQASLHTPPPTAQLNRNRIQIPRNPLRQLVTYNATSPAMVLEGVITSLPTPRSPVHCADRHIEHMRFTESLVTPSRIKWPSESLVQVPEPFNSPLSPLSPLPPSPVHHLGTDRDEPTSPQGSLDVTEDHENVSVLVTDLNNDGENRYREQVKPLRPIPSPPGQAARTSQSNSPVMRELSAKNSFFTFKLHALPIYPHGTHNSSIICTPRKRPNDVHERQSPRLVQTESQFVPSSQSQYMTTHDSSPRHEDRFIRSDTLLLEDDPDSRPNSGLVQSSQSQIEKELTLSRGSSQLLSGEMSGVVDAGEEDVSTDGSYQDKNAINTCPGFSDSLLAQTRSKHPSGICTPSSSQVQRLPSFPRMPSFDCAAFEFDTEDPLELPAQTGDMDDLFEDATTEDVQSREQNEHPSLPIHGACLEDSGDPSATESESDGDILDFFTDLVRQRGPGRSADRGESHQDSTGRLSQQTFVDYSDDLGAPFDIPDMFTPNLGGVNSSFEYSQQSLPEVAKDFFDMFQGTGSYPDDFPMSLR